MDDRGLGGARRILARLDRGDEVIESLTSLCRTRGIGCASLSGIGAVEDAEIGYYDLPSFAYQTQRIEGICELLSLAGNVALVDGEPFVHAHVVLGRRDLSTVGGHLVSARVGVTVEVFVDVMEGEIARAHDPEVRLKLLRLR